MFLPHFSLSGTHSHTLEREILDSYRKCEPDLINVLPFVSFDECHAEPGLMI